MLYIPAPWIRHGILIMPEFNGIFLSTSWFLHLRGQALHSSKVAEAVKHLTLQILPGRDVPLRKLMKIWFLIGYISHENHEIIRKIMKDHEKSWKIMKNHERSWKIMKDHERSSAPINCTLPLSPVTKASSWSIHQTINSSYNCTSDVKPLPVRIQMSANVVHRSLRHTSYRAMPCWKSCKIEILIVSDRILSYLSFWMFFVSTLRHDSPRYRDSASIASTQNP